MYLYIRQMTASPDHSKQTHLFPGSNLMFASPPLPSNAPPTVWISLI